MVTFEAEWIRVHIAYTVEVLAASYRLQRLPSYSSKFQRIYKTGLQNAGYLGRVGRILQGEKE